MLEYLNHLKEIHTDDESRIALEKIETALTEKKYGLVWEEHEEEVDKKLVHNIPVFKEIEDKKIVADENKDFNFLLEGDNLHSLKLLKKTHKGKIDVIYIDPPYNTGNKDFIYDDNYIGTDDGYRHSKWLSFMAERLKIAKGLLSQTGVILVSIDENEQSQLKLLMDEIFGEQNFVESIVWNKKSSAKGVPPRNMMVGVHEYILAYQVSGNFRFLGERRDESGFKNPDNDPRGPWRESNIKSTTKPIEEAFTITDPNTGKEYTNTWAFSKESLEKMIAEDRILWKAKLPKQKEFLNNMRNSTKALKSNWGLFDNQKTTMFLKKLLPHIQFNNPKPLELMKYLVEVAVPEGATILDFFAGSGTTGQAVMELNKEDGGKRKFILCTNNENGIAENVCYKRIEKVIRGYKYTNRKKEIDVEGIPHNLKYYKTEFIPKLSEDEEILSSKLLDYIKEMVELENMCEIDGNSRRIILSDEDLKMALSEMKEGGVLYIPSFILLTNEIKDSIEERKLEVVTIPDYYFTEELREVSEL